MQNDRDAPEILSTEELYQGEQIGLSIVAFREQGMVQRREIVRHPGSAAIVAAFDDGTIALVRQYRHPAVRYLLELPAGTLDDKEPPEEGAARELEEELGLVAGKMEKLSEFYISPGFCEEKMWLYLATDLTETAQRLEDDEMIEVVRLPIERALQMITDGEIEDAKTIIGLMLAAPRIGLSAFAPDYPAV
jgi:ADP-ribose pyrophosphatase